MPKDTSKDGNRILLPQGTIEGVSSADGAVMAFKGVPYAKPPVAELRWREPQPPEPWSGIRSAASFAPRCVQIQRPKGALAYFAPEPESEDCLYLNVWTAAPLTGERRPVMVWFHGGAYYLGSGALPIFNGEGLARQGVVLVTVNYRLGRLGFLAHPELTRESGRNASGNYGLMDQIAALRWVRDNIASFGGDPGCVTIFGQSSGSYSSSYFMGSPLARGLFHRVIGMSGAGFGPMAASSGYGEMNQDLDHAEKAGLAYAQLLGAKSLAELRSRSVYDIQMVREAADGSASYDRANMPKGRGMFDTTYPNIDGYVLPKTLFDIFGRGAQNDVPLLTGSVSHERGTTSQPPANVDAYIAGVRAEFGDLADRFLRLYPAETAAQFKQTSGTAIGDRLFTWQNWTWARMQTKTGKCNTFYYRYTRVPPHPPALFIDNPEGEPRAYHSTEIPYVFHTFDARDWTWPPLDRKLSETMSSYWVNFARTGNPNGPGLPDWPQFDAQGDTVMILGDAVKAGAVPHRDRLDFWDEFYRRLHAPAAQLAAAS